ncbi:hypothetical protein THASP1DRAFT_22959 [Thamnocephalis sphaerospora]|uniref:Uncharacterized protein n=1 Tax=Thamnocephalis sphaerospora TaxID=78915 RepID=A0A4P9XUA3_9FUNG|nr:hypothetical protein THASP1DRAFT_22959 [Thamnocephalis sphaerospora]|eukprot:RKP09161.1 hypothetical protein THASP1DRAFT_22959 [Thamnocephalis sphaerospora]
MRQQLMRQLYDSSDGSCSPDGYRPGDMSPSPRSSLDRMSEPSEAGEEPQPRNPSPVFGNISFDEMDSSMIGDQTVYLDANLENSHLAPSGGLDLPKELSILRENDSDIEAADAEVSRVFENMPLGDLGHASNDILSTSSAADILGQSDLLKSLDTLTTTSSKTKVDTTAPSTSLAWESAPSTGAPTQQAILDANGLKDTRSITASIYGEFAESSENDDGDGSFWINDDTNLAQMQRSDSRASDGTYHQRSMSAASFGLDDDGEDALRFQGGPTRLPRRSNSRASQGALSVSSTPQMRRQNSRNVVTPSGQSDTRSRSRTTPRRAHTVGRTHPARPPPHARPGSSVSNASSTSVRRSVGRPPIMSPSGFSQRSGNSDFQSEPAWAAVPAKAGRRSGSSASNTRAHARRPSWASSRSSDSTSQQQQQQHRRVPSSPMDAPGHGARPMSVASSRSSGSTGRFHARPGSSASSGAAYPTADPQWVTPATKKAPGVPSSANSHKKQLSKEPSRSLSAFAIADESEPEPEAADGLGSMLRGFGLDTAADTSFDPDESGDFGTMSLRASAAPTTPGRSTSVNSNRSLQSSNSMSLRSTSSSGRRPGSSIRDFEFPSRPTARSNSVASNGSDGISLRSPTRVPGYGRDTGDMMSVVAALNKSRSTTSGRA